MKILIFGDVHGNLPALEMFFLREKNNYDALVCHGDVVNYGPWTNECIALLNDMPSCTILKGNHENYFINGSYDGTNIIANTFFEHCYSNFYKSLVNIIDSYGCKIQLEDFTIQHTLNNQYIFSDTDISDLEIDTNYIIGHSHQQYERAKNKFKIYNTGSLGQNRKYINQSCYLKFDTSNKIIELKNFTYDINTVINQMKAEKYPLICIDYYRSKMQL